MQLCLWVVDIFQTLWVFGVFFVVIRMFLNVLVNAQANYLLRKNKKRWEDEGEWLVATTSACLLLACRTPVLAVHALMRFC